MAAALLRATGVPMLLAAAAFAAPAPAQTWPYFGTDVADRVRARAAHGSDLYMDRDLRNIAGDEKAAYVAR